MITYYSPDALGSIEVTYYDDDNYISIMATLKYPNKFSASYISYANKENVKKSKQYFKGNGMYKNTKNVTIESTDSLGYTTPFITYKDNYYYVLNYYSSYDENKTETTLSISSLFYTIDIEVKISDSNYQYNRFGVPFP